MQAAIGNNQGECQNSRSLTPLYLAAALIMYQGVLGLRRGDQFLVFRYSLVKERGSQRTLPYDANGYCT